MEIPFDQPGSTAKYEIDFFPRDAASGDGIILAANREGLLALAETFRQLAESESAHLHLGYDEREPQGPGFRIMLCPSGRISTGEA
jgi:hypothetical protein